MARPRLAALEALTQVEGVASTKRSCAAAATLLVMGAWAVSCQQPIQPSVGALPPLDASKEVEAIQREEEKLSRDVPQPSQLGAELEAAHRLVRSPEDDAGPFFPDGGQLSRPPDSQIAGKLERATRDWIVIRDDSGFAYWLRAGESTQVTANGKPARLTDFKQGTEVRAEFFWAGKERIATAVEVLAES